MSTNPGIELKDKGNKAFAESKFSEADALYSEAILLLGDKTPHTLFGNRAAARLGMGKAEDALQDAEEAIKKEPGWIKGYHRKACAHRALGQEALALAAYQQAKKVDPDNKWLVEQVRQVEEKIVGDSKEKPLQSIEAWLTVFSCVPDSRERLCTLAHFWNHCGVDERYQIFGRFLSLIAGEGGNKTHTAHTGVKHEDFGSEMMVSLPMENYQDLKPEENWMAFFSALSKDEKVAVFEKMWENTKEFEKEVIVNDLRHFFLQPLLEKRFGGAEVDDDDDDDDEQEEEEEEEEEEGGSQPKKDEPFTADREDDVHDPGQGEAVA